MNFSVYQISSKSRCVVYETCERKYGHRLRIMRSFRACMTESCDAYDCVQNSLPGGRQIPFNFWIIT